MLLAICPSQPPFTIVQAAQSVVLSGELLQGEQCSV